MNTKPPKHKCTRGRNSLAGVDPVERPILKECSGTAERLVLGGPDMRRTIVQTAPNVNVILVQPG